MKRRNFITGTLAAVGGMLAAPLAALGHRPKAELLMKVERVDGEKVVTVLSDEWNAGAFGDVHTLIMSGGTFAIISTDDPATVDIHNPVFLNDLALPPIS